MLLVTTTNHNMKGDLRVVMAAGLFCYLFNIVCLMQAHHYDSNASIADSIVFNKLVVNPKKLV